jgi:hypothetical protein
MSVLKYISLAEDTAYMSLIADTALELGNHDPFGG